MVSQREKALEIAAQVNAKLGGNAVKLASEPEFEVTYLPTGVVPIDILLGGGLPRNRFTEVYGDYSTLKTWVALKAIATTQANGGMCCFIDTENAFDPAWARRCGVDVDALIYRHPDNGEEGIDMANVLLREHDIDLLVWDSIAATEPQDIQKKRQKGENSQPGRLAALMSEGLRALNTANSNTAMLFINQTRLSIGITFGDPTAIPGGKAMGFYAAYRLCFRKTGKVREDVDQYIGGKRTSTKQTVAQQIKVSIDKSKVSAPHKDTTLLWDFAAGGLDEEDFILGLAMESGLATTNGKGQWTIEGETFRCAANRVTAAMRERPHLLAKLRADLGLPGQPVPAKKRVVRRKG